MRALSAGLIPHLTEANATAYVRASDDLDRVGGHHGHGLGQQVVGADAAILYPSGGRCLYSKAVLAM
jgi:hypothetical protein